MKGRNTITINGRLYDAVSGMPVAAVDNAAPLRQQDAVSSTQPRSLDIAAPVRRVAPSVHQQPQKSQTLHRAALARPTIKTAPSQQAIKKPNIQRSPVISKFGGVAPQQTPVQVQQTVPQQPEATEQPQVHPAVARALNNLNQRQAPQKPELAQSPKELKEALIKERLAEVETTEKTKVKKSRNPFKRSRLSAIATSTLAVLLLGGYLTYINLPNISMRVAATRAGVAANFPGYQPAGYSFEGPITYSTGEVAVRFKDKDNKNFTVTQKTSNWDSQAVLDNYILKQTDSYLTYQEHGLTIYSYENKAAWVNGGMLYSIEGNANLSGEQILSIATSM